MTADPRLAQLEENLDAVRRRLAQACAAAGRPSQDVTLIAVSKTWPAADVLALHSLGVSDFGESYDQEASAKAATLAAMDCRPRWHFVGRLQRNKCSQVARYAETVHAVDRPELVDALAGAAVRAGRVVGVLVQFSFDGDLARGGAPVDGVLELAGRIAAADGLTIRGVMAVPPLGADAVQVYAALAAVSARVQREHPVADVISAGMSSDLEAAIATGSTCVRVGTALFGGRAHAHH